MKLDRERLMELDWYYNPDPTEIRADSMGFAFHLRRYCYTTGMWWWKKYHYAYSLQVWHGYDAVLYEDDVEDLYKSVVHKIGTRRVEREHQMKEQLERVFGTPKNSGEDLA